MKIPFNEGWTFYKENDEKNMRTVTLPHDAMLYETRSADAAGKGASAYFPGGVYIYEKTLDLTAELAKRHLVLEFEGVYKNAVVSVNGEEIYHAAYGFSPFFVPLDGHLVSGENQIRVKADNSNQPDSRWYSGAGIYRPVTLHSLPKEHIFIEGVRVKTVSLDGVSDDENGAAKFAKAAKLLISATHTGGVSNVAADILDADGNVVLTCELKRDLQGSPNADSETAVTSAAECEIPNANLWSAENPYLYTVCVRADEDERVAKFGVRTLSWSPKGFFVNGKETLLRGGCVHHDNGILGACAYTEAEERRVRILKENGFNAIRSAHNPCSKAMLDACDKYGVYVMDELYDMWYKHKQKYDYATEFQENYRYDIAALARRDYNHPSVIMYSIGNEVSEPASEKGVALSKEMYDCLKELDDTRAVTAGYNLMIMKNSAGGKDLYDGEEGGKDESNDEKMNGMNSTMFNLVASMVGTGMNKAANGKKADAATSPALDVLDVCGYNYASGRYPNEGKLHPDRIVMGSETFPQDIAKNWEMVEKYPYLIGDFMWVAWDYIGETGIGAWSYEADAKGFEKPYPWLLADTGALDILGDPNAELFLAQAAWGEAKPKIGVRPCNHPDAKLIKATWRGTNALPSWSWKNCGGNSTVVEVYAKADKVELFINHRSLGKKKVKECRAVYKTKYERGMIEAVSYDASGNELGRSTLTTAKGELRISATPEKTEISVGEVVFVPIYLTGADGVIESNADETLTVGVTGGTLLGFGSANPRTTENFYSGTYTTYYGRALAAVRAEKAGTLTVHVAGDGGKSADAVIRVN